LQEWRRKTFLYDRRNPLVPLSGKGKVYHFISSGIAGKKNALLTFGLTQFAEVAYFREKGKIPSFHLWEKKGAIPKQTSVGGGVPIFPHL